MTVQKEVILDSRRRTSLARIGQTDHDKYLVQEYGDGTIVLSPAVTITQTEMNLLRNPEFRAALDVAAQLPLTAGRPRPRLGSKIQSG